MIEATCLTVDEDGMLCLMMADGELKEDLKLPTDAHLIGVAREINRIVD